MSQKQSQNRWDARLYDDKLSFVAEFGKGVIDWLQPSAGESILDLGCGTGDLTAELAARGAVAVGIDLSPEMIETARKKYPHLRFDVADAHDFTVSEPVDAVFSNAALHWMKQPELVVRSVSAALRPGGRFVAEFGGKGNVSQIEQAIQTVLAAMGIDARERHPWYFPSIGEYSTLLERNGFRVLQAAHFDRPTPLPDGERGIRNWLAAFGGPFFQGMSEDEIASVYSRIAEQLRPVMFRDGVWVADYKRIRILAVKERTEENGQ
jgi:trans-aconitate methyltransferase